MSRHHILPPIVYTPPQPKKVETRKRIRKRDATSSTAVDDAGTSGETTTFIATRAPTPPRDPYAPIEGADSQTQRSPGKLSADTLKVMLLAQEMENAPSDGVAASTKV